ncbi:hypothetical protein B9Z55_012826 [Caenorhabditis nigoni]|uniref:RING-type domain-containing protein n=1 Tax=Caenorhabditis nigoni TaxID=1611254 RepID=A0A2G5TZ22_9PELO|nr:hypothetical protein B9Z55_012826 [Caenorhabditis nigoni]
MNSYNSPIFKNVIPDFVGRINETNAKKNVYSPITTIGRKGEFLLKLRESALYIFNNVICGVDWKTAIRENGIADYLNFRKTFEDTLKPLFCEWEMSHLDKNWHDEIITNLRKHKIFENQRRANLNFFEDFAEDSLVPTAHFKEQCEAFNLPPMPHLGSLPDAMLVVEAKVLILVVWTCQFYPRLDAPKEQGDSAMQREVIRNAMFLRMPMESKFRKQFTNLIAYWSETRASVRRTMTLEPTEPARKPSQLELEEEASRNLIRAVVLEKKKQKKEKRNANGAEVSVATAKREDDVKDVESSRESSGKSSKSLKVQEEATKKMEKGQEPNKDGKGGAQLLKKLDNISGSSANPNGLSKKSEKLPNPGYEGPRSSATNESFRSSSTSNSEPCSSQKSLSKDEIPVKKQNLMIELMEYVKQLCEENETLKSKIEERREEDSNTLRKAKKELGKEEKTDKLEQNRKSSLEIMEKNLIEAEKQRDVANQKLRKAEEKLRKEIGFNVEMGYQLRGEKKDLEIMIREKELALEETVKEWTERWNVERYQVEQAQKKTAKLEQDWKLSFEFMEKNQIEAEEQRDVANEKLRKTEEELREQIAISRNLEQQLKEANMALTAMNKEKDRAVEAKERAVVREWTERWNVERYQVELAQKKITEVESKVRQLTREKEKLLEKQSENLHLQNRTQELSNQPGPSSQQVSEDPNVYLERIQKMLANLNRDDSIEEKRIRISRLLTGTDSAETREICVLEEDLFDASVTMYRDILNFNKYKVQQTQCTAECQTIPIYPDLSKRFLNLEKKEKGKAMFEEGECAVCFEKMEDFEETRTCPHEKCSLVYHAKCIQKSVENKAVCPYCQKPYYDVQEFPDLA